MRPEAKASEWRNRDSIRAQNTGAAGGVTDLRPNHPNPKVGEGQTDRKVRTNHEGQPKQQTSQPADTVDAAAEKHTHPKVRESQQGDDTGVQRADTTPTVAPGHRVQNPANPRKPAGAGEAQKKEGKGRRPTHATRVAGGQAPGDRKGRKPPQG